MFISNNTAVLNSSDTLRRLDRVRCRCCVSGTPCCCVTQSLPEGQLQRLRLPNQMQDTLLFYGGCRTIRLNTHPATDNPQVPRTHHAAAAVLLSPKLLDLQARTLCYALRISNCAASLPLAWNQVRDFGVPDQDLIAS
jgi:hypothetical protein